MAIPTPQRTIINASGDPAIARTEIALATANGGVYILNTTKDIYVTAVDETYTQQFVTNQTVNTITNNPGNVVDGVQFNNNGNFAADAQFTYDPNTDTLTLENLLIANGIANLGPVANIRIANGSSGQVLSTDGAGHLSWLSVSGSSSIANGNSNISISANGNVNFGVSGNANVFTVDANSVTVKSTNGNLVLGRATATGSPGLSSTTSFTLNANRGNTENAWLFDTVGALNLPNQGVVRNPTNQNVNIVGNGFVQLQWTTVAGAASPDPNATTDPTNWLYLDNTGAHIETNVNNGNSVSSFWNFGTDGNTGLPGSINFPNSSINVATANFIGIYPTGGITDQTYLELQEGANGYAALTSNTNIILSSGKSASAGNSWIFDAAGVLSLPQNLGVGAAVIQPSGTDFGLKLIVNGATWTYGTIGDLSTPGTVTIGNNANVTGNLNVTLDSNLQGQTTIANLQATVAANTTATLGNLITVTVNGTSYKLMAV